MPSTLTQEEAASTSLLDIADETSSSSSEWDHEYTGDSNSSHPPSPPLSSSSKIVLYGTIGTDSMCKAHKRLSQGTGTGTGAAGGAYCYSFRHSFAGLTQVQSTTPLKGFGVVLDIKNMEVHLLLFFPFVFLMILVYIFFPLYFLF